MHEQRTLATDPSAFDAEVDFRHSGFLTGIRTTVSLHELRDYPRLTMPVVAAALRRIGAVRTGPPTALFRPRAGSFDVTAGYPTAVRHTIGRPFAADQLPGGRVVHVLHAGPWSTLLSSYDRLCEWLGAHRVPQVPLMWEEYVVGPETVDDPTAWRTRIVVPLPDDHR